MKKVLIVDDEFLVRLGLKTTLDWSTHGYEIVGEASSGEEALELFSETRPDILMTDIKMSGMDGLELIKKVMEIDPDVQAVILTNYDDFNFARSAMQLGATQYILKSEITEKSLLKALHSLSVSESGPGVVSQTAEEMHSKYLHEQLLKICIDNEDMEIIKLHPLRDGMFNHEQYAVFSIFIGTSLLEANSIDMAKQTIKSWVEKLFISPTIDFIDFKEHSRAAIITPAESYSAENIAERSQILVKNIAQYFDVILHVGVSRLASSKELDELFVQAELARKSCFFTNDSVVLFDSSMRTVTESAPKISQSNIKELMSRPDTNDVKDKISSIFDKLKELKNYQYVKNTFIDLLSLAKYMCEEYDMLDSPSLSSVKFEYSNFESIELIDNVEHYLLEVYDGVWGLIYEKSNSYSRVIRDCIQFIEENYHDQITLEDAATAVNLSPSYLSFLFKQETSINFNTYLTNYRIDESKKLITTSNMKIYEIADKVGFGSPYYFSKVFKDTTNMTCKEFKNNHS